MQHKNGQLRIIGGKWRSRKISFANLATIRPTQDAVRETLFNWLAPYIENAKCLDCFAGSGALGFEALSRGANFITMIDQERQVIKKLEENAKLLDTENNIELICAKFPSDKIKIQNLDIVFLDPPFNKNMVMPCCKWLEDNNCLKAGTLIYIEIESRHAPLTLPENWQLLKNKKAGQASYYLYLRTNSIYKELNE
jgi:16S rRNA (guanine966-N2)-methyltransferase